MPVLESRRYCVDVDRGPDWLFLRLRNPPEGRGDCEDFAETVWDAMQQHFTHRIVLELDEVRVLHSRLIGQLVKLHKRVSANGGLMRVCGLSQASEDALRIVRLDNHFPSFRTRADAVMGHRPAQAR